MMNTTKTQEKKPRYFSWSSYHSFNCTYKCSSSIISSSIGKSQRDHHESIVLKHSSYSVVKKDIQFSH